MRPRTTFVLVWLGLFAATVIMRGFVAGRHDRLVPPDPEEQRQRLLAELEAKPRKTILLDEELLAAGPRISAFDKELSVFVRANKEQLHLCNQRIMKNSDRVNEYFELSFVLHPVSMSGDRQVVQLREVVLERSTISLSRDDEKCIVDAIAALEPEVADVPSSRVMYQLCFQNTKSNSG